MPGGSGGKRAGIAWPPLIADHRGRTRRKPGWQAKRRYAPMMPPGGVTPMVYRSFTADDEIVPQREGVS
jgi:hypothetical protein